MYTFFRALTKKKILIPFLFCLLALISLAMLPLVVINYDLAEYLPEDSGTKRAIEAAQKEFDYPGTAEVMAKNISLAEAAALKQKIAKIPGIKNVLWLDDVADITKPVEFIPPELLENYYLDGCALFHLEFAEDNYAQSTSTALEEIAELDEGLLISGNAENSRNMKNILSGEIGKIVAIVLPVCLLILFFASSSWLEPPIYLLIIGISIAINMGSNAFFGSISFITNAMASLLQLAISMDYSIFLMHRYFEERDQGRGVQEAVINAAVKTLSPISASALTTIAGFSALLLMQYRIGADIGLVLAKGISISFLVVILLMPVLIILFSKILDKTRHRRLLPPFKNIGSAVVKMRYLIIVLAVLIIIPTLLAQGKNEFIYGESSVRVEEGKVYEDQKEIHDRFGVNNPVMMLVPKGDPASEIMLTDELKNLPHIQEVTALVTIANKAIPASFLPDTVKNSFTSENYSRIVVYLDTDGETPESFEAVQAIRTVSQKYYPNQWLAAGLATSLSDIKDTVTKDSKLVLLMSLLAVGLVVLFTFKSLSLPVIILFVIQVSVWLNMSIPYFTGFKIAFIGYLVISALQLGATIDYGILLTSRYLEFRNAQTAKVAAVSAIKTAGPSILVSALILSSAGFGFGIVSQIGSISELGVLIGRGALTSCGMTIFLLPGMLVTLDRLIFKTTLPKRKGVLKA